MSRTPALLALLPLALASLAACGKPAAPAAPAAAPLDAALQQLYDSSCKSCHNQPASGAPQQGDAAAWAPRLALGKEVLIGHVINGYQKMPPMGLCMQCSEEEFLALTEHLSGQQLQ